MNYIQKIEQNMTSGEKRRLQNIWEPQIVATPPSNAWMDMCVMPDGEIRHYGKYRGERVYIASRDGGLSWKTCDVENMTTLCSAMQSPYSGRWIQSYFLQGEGGFQGSEMPTPPKGASGWQAALSDEGPGGQVKWVKICDNDVRCPRHPLALKHRQRILITANHYTWPMSPIVARTDDEGETWQVSVLKAAPLHEPAWPHQGVRWQNGACEATIMERGDGSLLLIARTSQDYHYSYESFDGGETWTDPQPTTLHGTLTMPTLLKLSTGEGLIFFCNTQPLAEVNHRAVTPPLSEGEIQGTGEDVFTNRDANHCAITFDDGKTWHGFRELALNAIRNEPDFRTKGGSDEVLDKSVHQFQAMELPFGKVLLSFGQHRESRRMLIFDPKWLLEKERQEDFRQGLVNMTTHVYLKSVSGNFRGFSGHCAWNRTSGAVLMPSPDSDFREALYIKANPDERLFTPLQGAAWNFPAAKCGELTITLRPGEEGLAVTLTDRWFNPCDAYTGVNSPFQITIYASQCPKNEWSTLVCRWSAESCEFWLDDQLISHCNPACEMPNGLSYVILQSALTPSAKSGSYIKCLQMSVI
ncbi:MAG: exo-alpha-sialidase [Clostridiales bacterium]|nr:exo-alpha-sialidase [Clostridiales bacterium]